MPCGVAVTQVQFRGVSLYDCGTKYYPADYRTNPRCTLVPPSGVQDELSTPVSFLEPCEVCQGAAAIHHCPTAALHTCTTAFGGFYLMPPGGDCTIMPLFEDFGRFRTQASPNEWPWEAIVLIGWLVLFRFLVSLSSVMFALVYMREN